MTFSTLRALLATISVAIDDIERVYHERSATLDFPSLDVPCYRTAPQSPEEELWEELEDDPVVAFASKRVAAACAQLSMSVKKRWLGVMDNAQGCQLAACVGFLEAANVVEILREAGPGGMDVDDIFHSIMETRSHSPTASPPGTESLTPAIVGRILRLLATAHYLREVRPNVFANNRPSSLIDSGKTVAQLRAAPEKKYEDTDGVAACVGMLADQTMKAMAYLIEWTLPDKPIWTGTAATEGEGLKVATESEVGGELMRYSTPRSLAFKMDIGYFEWIELPGNERRMRHFTHAMTSTRHWDVKYDILQGFPYDQLRQGAVIVDVGGGIGSHSLVVADTYPHLRVIVEDRPQIVANATNAWGTRYAHLVESGRVMYRARDFFQEWTAVTLPDLTTVEHPDLFLLRLILHDWNDDNARKILHRLRAAAGPHTKLLIGDTLLVNACSEDSDGAAAGTNVESSGLQPRLPPDSPLLPNVGAGNIQGYLLDFVMLGCWGVGERMVDQMSALLLSAGWRIAEIRRSPGSLWAYTTAVPV